MSAPFPHIFPEERRDQMQDHPDIIAALEDLNVRMDVDEEGWIWRVFLYEKNGDETLAQLKELEGLKEVWTLGSRVSKKGIEEFQEEMPDVEIRQ